MRNHFGFPLGFENIHSKTTFLSFPSFTVWSINGFMKLSCFYSNAANQGTLIKQRKPPENKNKKLLLNAMRTLKFRFLNYCYQLIVIRKIVFKKQQLKKSTGYLKIGTVIFLLKIVFYKYCYLSIALVWENILFALVRQECGN